MCCHWLQNGQHWYHRHMTTIVSVTIPTAPPHFGSLLKLHRMIDLCSPVALLYAEMYAYSMAAAHLDLKHNLVKDLFTGCMVDWPKNKNDKEKELVYNSAKSYVEWFAASEANEELISETHQCLDPELKPPPFLHYCRRYSFPVPFPDTIPGRSHSDIKAPYRFFAKRRVEHDVLDCVKGSDGDVFVPFISEENGKSDGDMSWNAIAVCSLAQAINAARQSGCST